MNMNTLQKLHRHHKVPIITIVSAVAFIVILTSLQFLKPDFNPKWHVISEYEDGSYGWLMRVAFVFLSLMCFSLFIALRSLKDVKVSRTGLALVCLAGIGAAMACVFVSDPITTSHYDWHGILHLVGSAFFVPTIPIGGTLIVRSLLSNTAWRSFHRIIVASTILLWTGLLSMGVTMTLTFRGKFGPSVPVGWPNRYLILVYCLWMVLLSWQVLMWTRRHTTQRLYA